MTRQFHSQPLPPKPDALLRVAGGDLVVPASGGATTTTLDGTGFSTGIARFASGVDQAGSVAFPLSFILPPVPIAEVMVLLGWRAETTAGVVKWEVGLAGAKVGTDPLTIAPDVATGVASPAFESPFPSAPLPFPPTGPPPGPSLVGGRLMLTAIPLTLTTPIDPPAMFLTLGSDAMGMGLFRVRRLGADAADTVGVPAELLMASVELW